MNHVWMVEVLQPYGWMPRIFLTSRSDARVCAKEDRDIYKMKTRIRKYVAVSS